MSKTITLRVDEDTYNIFKVAAQGEKRSISNYIEFATISYLSNQLYVSDEEMSNILSDRQLISNLKKAENDIKEGKYRIV
jgi:uncharacterized protein (DUF1778 family)